MTSSPRPRWFTDTRPGHSQWFIERFRALEAEGADLLGEARFADMLAERGSRILDAGCGTGRLAAALQAAGHEAIGVDVDPELIDAARNDHPGPSYAVADLSALTLADVGGEPVDLVMCAGNVMVFLAPDTERLVIERLCAMTRPGGRVAIGFRREDAYPFERYDADLATLADQGVARVEHRFSTWHLDPYESDSDFAVTILRVLVTVSRLKVRLTSDIHREGAAMSFVNITALTYPPGAEAEIERRFAARRKAVDQAPGFREFELLRPAFGEDRYFVMTRWDSRQDYEAWSAARPTPDHADDERRGMRVEALGFEAVQLD